jgi:glycosyltransferase involved in cell wall biosynthesis
VSVLFLTHEPLTESIAGPSIRAWELAHELAKSVPVTLGTPNQSPRRSPTVEVRCFADGSMPELLKRHDTVIAFGFLLREYPMIRKMARYLVMDIYGPFVLENLHQHVDHPILERMAMHQNSVDVVLEQLEQADFLICASERQRDFWLGALSVANRINPYTAMADPTLRSLIDVVPFGLPSIPPRASQPGIKGTASGIGPSDFVLLWSGGIWNWFDPITPIEAVAALSHEMPQIKLYFMGVQHPNPLNPRMAMAAKAVETAERLGVLNKSVFFSEGWIPYEERVNYLCDADVAVSIHSEHVETRFAFRTRFLDYLWAGLPIIASSGDVLSDETVMAGAAIPVANGDVDGMRRAIRELATDATRRQGMAARAQQLAAQFTWPKVAAPLVNYCRQPWRAADRDRAILRPRIRQRPWHRVAAVYRREGPAGVVRRIAGRARKRLGR